MTIAIEPAMHTLKQPPVFKLACLTAMCERFGFYVVSFLIVLYTKSEFGLSDAAAFTMFGIFTALSYLSTALGGYLADNVYGIRRCVISGLILESLGLYLLAIPNNPVFPVALACIIIGVGLFKTAPTHLMARSYAEKDPRIDPGFTMFYMSMNAGSFVSSILCALIQRYYGWHVTFAIGGTAILIGLILYFIFRKTAATADSMPGKAPLQPKIWIAMLFGALVAIGAGTFLVAHANIANIVLGICTIFLFVYFGVEIAKSPRIEKFKIIACVSLIIMGFVFFVLYFQAYTSILLFIKRSVIRNMMGIEVPAVAYYALNPIFCIILGPILAMIYSAQAKKGKSIAVTTKFPLGLLVTTLCFFTLVASSYFANAEGQVSSWWVVLAYLFYTLGEMLVSALGVAMVTHIAPKRMYGVMMGAWFLIGSALSASMSGLFAGIAEIPEALTDPMAVLHIYANAFSIIGLASLVCTAIAFAVSPYIKRIAQL